MDVKYEGEPAALKKKKELFFGSGNEQVWGGGVWKGDWTRNFQLLIFG